MKKEINGYEQFTSYSCGPASLCIALEKFGIKLNEMEVAYKVGANPETGTKIEDMQRFVTRLGIPSELKLLATYEELQEDTKKGIAIVMFTPFWGGESGGHYAVVEDALDDMIELADSGLPLEDKPNIMNRNEFENKWIEEGYEHCYLLIKEDIK